jgi:hypothetical protein
MYRLVIRQYHSLADLGLNASYLVNRTTSLTYLEAQAMPKSYTANNKVIDISVYEKNKSDSNSSDSNPSDSNPSDSNPSDSNPNLSNV